jgi:hypothetical protein
MARRLPVPARYKVKIASLEANLAFCDALITFAGQIPETIYQRAQIRLYKHLAGVLAHELEDVKAEARLRAKKLTA